MGAKASTLTKDEVSEYQELTFLTKQEIIQADKIFQELLGENRSRERNPRVSQKKILTLPELKSNPFGDRICHVFSTCEVRDGSLSFKDFLDLLSAFSDSATMEIKSHYAFRIFDFDDDGTLDAKDLEKLVKRLTGDTEEKHNRSTGDLNKSSLSDLEMKQLIDNILEESDIDKDGTVNLSEFQHVISRSPDFVSSFKIVL